LKTLFEKRVFKLSQKLSGQGQSSRRALLRPAVLTTAPIKLCLQFYSVILERSDRISF